MPAEAYLHSCPAHILLTSCRADKPHVHAQPLTVVSSSSSEDDKPPVLTKERSTARAASPKCVSAPVLSALISFHRFSSQISSAQPSSAQLACLTSFRVPHQPVAQCVGRPSLHLLSKQQSHTEQPPSHPGSGHAPARPAGASAPSALRGLRAPRSAASRLPGTGRARAAGSTSPVLLRALSSLCAATACNSHCQHPSSALSVAASADPTAGDAGRGCQKHESTALSSYPHRQQMPLNNIVNAGRLRGTGAGPARHLASGAERLLPEGGGVAPLWYACQHLSPCSAVARAHDTKRRLPCGTPAIIIHPAQLLHVHRQPRVLLQDGQSQAGINNERASWHEVLDLATLRVEKQQCV